MTRKLGVAGLLGGLLASWTGCQGCSTPAPGGSSSSSSGAASANTSGASSGMASGGSGSAGASSSAAGSSGSSGSSGASGTGVDAGSPLEQPRDLFCRGSGAILGGGAASTCAGQLAQDTFTFAVCACDNINVGANLSVDAFNSTRGGYGASTDAGINIQDDGHLGINGGPLLLDNKLQVAGHLYVANIQGDGGVDAGLQMGPGSSVAGNMFVFGHVGQTNNTSGTIGRNAYVHGNISSRYTVAGNLYQPAGFTSAATVQGTRSQLDFPQRPPCPCAANERIDIASYTQAAAGNNDNAAAFDGGTLSPDLWATDTGPADLHLPCGRYYLSSVNRPGTTVRVIPEGRVVLFVDGDFHVKGISIDVSAPGAELDTFVKGDLTVDSAASFGDSSKPSSVRTYVGGAMSLSASANFAGNIYAPNGDVSFGASANIYGALFVRRASFNASASVHYDSAIRGAGASCEAPDAGMPQVDAGPVAGDAGLAGTDAAVAVVDAGSTAADAGSTVPDASVTVPDAGPPTCANVCSGECGVQACLVPSGGSFGMCGACGTDLDCCAPQVCVGGMCLFIGG